MLGLLNLIPESRSVLAARAVGVIRPGDGGNPIHKRRGCPSEIFEKRYQDPILRAWLKMFFTPQRYQFKNNTLSPQCLRLNTLKVAKKPPDVDLLKLNNLRITKAAFSSSKSSPVFYLWEFPLISGRCGGRGAAISMRKCS